MSPGGRLPRGAGGRWPEVDEVICCRPSWSLITVAHAYEDLREVPEREARQVLEHARQLTSPDARLGVQGSGDWV